MSLGEDRGRLSSDTLDALDSLESLWAEVEKARSEAGFSVGVKPEGSITVKEYAERFSVSESTARKQLNAMIRSGSMAEITAYVADSRGHMVRLPVFHPIKKP